MHAAVHELIHQRYSDQLAKIRQQGWKEHLKISTHAKFERDLLKTNEQIAPQSRRIFRTFVW